MATFRYTFTALICILIGISYCKFSNASSSFDNELFNVVAKDRLKENVIISPASIQVALALGYFGAGGETANEILKALRLDGVNKNEILQKYEQILEEQLASSSTSSSSSRNSELTMANKIWANENNKIKLSFQNIARNSFHSETASIDFKGDGASEKLINQWVEEKTNHKIRNLLKPGTLDESTNLVLVNAIYFKGKWLKQFLPNRTRKIDFWITPTSSVQIDSMRVKHKFNFLASKELDAKILEIPYIDNNMTMVIILPNSVDGLEELEKKLNDVDLLELSNAMHKTDVDLFLPKFKVDLRIGLKSIFKQMGIKKMFNDEADFSGIFESNMPSKVFDIQHKAHIDVNEAGTEASASTYLRVAGVSGMSNIKKFKADHPFIFFIKDSKFVYFIGHIAKF